MSGHALSVGVSLGSVSRLAGGMFNSVSGLTRNLKGLSVFSTIYGPEDAYSDPDRAAWGGANVVFSPVRRPRKFGYAPQIAHRILTSEHDILHQHGLWQGQSVVSLKWRKQRARPLMISPRGMLDEWALKQSWLKKQIALACYERSNIRQANCLHALCEAELRSIRAFGYKGPIAVIPNGADLVALRKTLSPAAWDGHFSADNRILLFLGRLHPKKGLEDFLHAIAPLPQENWRLVIAGWGSAGYIEKIKGLVAHLQLAEKVLFVGPLHGADKDAAFMRADAFVLPSQSEGLPMAVLEAWSYGLPVLMTPACNFTHADNAAIVVPMNRLGLQQGYLKLVQISDEQRRSMGECGRNLLRQRFSWPDIAKQTRQTYDWILHGGQVPSWVDTG